MVCPLEYGLGNIQIKAPSNTSNGIAKSLDTFVIELPIAKYSSTKAVLDVLNKVIANKVKELKP